MVLLRTRLTICCMACQSERIEQYTELVQVSPTPAWFSQKSGSNNRPPSAAERKHRPSRKRGCQLINRSMQALRATPLPS